MHRPNPADLPGQTDRNDVFISYSAKDPGWVSWLRQMVAQWRDLGLKVFFDKDSAHPGEPVLAMIRRGQGSSRHTVFMLNHAAKESEWMELELALTYGADPAGRRRQSIPVLLEEIPREDLGPFSHLTVVDLADPDVREAEYRRLLNFLGVVVPEGVGCPRFPGESGLPSVSGGNVAYRAADHREGEPLAERRPALSLTAAEIWSRILDGARAALPETVFRTWLAPTQAVAVSRNLLVVSTPNPFAVDLVEDKYGDLLTGIGEQLFGWRFTLYVQFQPNGKPPASVALPSASVVSAPSTTTVSTRGPSVLKPKYTFERFVIGNNNQLAAAAAHAVARAPGRHYNPLFIHGGVGLGKTHLMHAIGNALLERDPDKRVLYLSSERFTNEMVGAIQSGTMADFRRQYRQIDLLLVDDVQFLEGKEGTQEEFFHTFNALHDAQKQIVLTSDRQPKEIGLEERLVSRFEWGLVAEISRPDFETRMAILRRKAEEDWLVLHGAEDVLTFIALYRTSSVRELEGALIKLLAYSSLTGRPIDLALAQEALGGPMKSGGRAADQFSLERLCQKVAQAWGTSSEALRSRKRTKDLTFARQVAMFLTRELFDMPLAEIGRFFGGRDESTVLHAITKVEEGMAADPAFRQRLSAIRQSLR